MRRGRIDKFEEFEGTEVLMIERIDHKGYIEAVCPRTGNTCTSQCPLFGQVMFDYNFEYIEICEGKVIVLKERRKKEKN